MRLPKAEFLVTLTEADPENAMDSGLILPEPGHERECSTRTAPR
jgi:hypothetical protein